MQHDRRIPHFTQQNERPGPRLSSEGVLWHHVSQVVLSASPLAKRDIESFGLSLRSSQEPPGAPGRAISEMAGHRSGQNGGRLGEMGRGVDAIRQGRTFEGGRFDIEPLSE